MSFRKVQRPGGENPGKSLSTVAAPSDPVTTREDVERKLKIYGAIQALRQGRLPDNKQLDDALVFLRDTISKRVETPKPESLAEGGKHGEPTLSDEGRIIVADARDIVDTTRQILKQRNPDEVLQDFVHHVFNVRITSPSSGVELPFSVDEARKDGETAVHHLRTILRLIITNREARKLLKDSKLILRDLFAQTAIAAAERARPSAQELRGLDDGAPAQDWIRAMDDIEGDEVFVDAVSEIQDENDLQGENRHNTNTAEDANGKQGTPSTVPTKTPPNKPTSEGEKGTMSGAASARKPFNFNLKDRLRSLAGRVPERHRARVQQEYNGARAYLTEEFPPDRRDQFVWRLKKVIGEAQSTETYQESISWFLTVTRGYFSSTRTVAASQASQTNDLFAGDPLLARAVSELRTIAERGAGGRTLNTVLEAVNMLWNDAREDAEMRKWWRNVEGFLRKALLKPGYITSPEFTSHARKLRASGRFFFTQRHKHHTDSLVEAAQTWSRAWLEDPLHGRLYEQWGKLIRDLLFDDKGGLVFKSDLWRDMRKVILPGLMRKVGVIPIPRIEYVDEDLKLVIENLALQGENIFPKTIEIIAQHYSKLETQSTGEDQHTNSLTLTFSGIQADMRDVAFQYHRRLRLGDFKDAGLADVFIGGRGITVKIKITSVSGPDHAKGSLGVFNVEDLHVRVEELKFRIKESRHDFLYKTLRPIATKLIKKQISKAFGDGIRSALKYAEEQLAAARDAMTDAEAENGSRKDVLKSVLRKRSLEITERSKRKSTFRVVPQHQSMLLPDMGHRSGWVRRQTEMDHDATQGEGWRSEAFNLATAATSRS